MIHDCALDGTSGACCLCSYGLKKLSSTRVDEETAGCAIAIFSLPHFVVASKRKVQISLSKKNICPIQLGESLTMGPAAKC